ncbi:MAG: PH domain-containing protein [Planctomycetota bacterium]
MNQVNSTIAPGTKSSGGVDSSGMIDSRFGIMKMKGEEVVFYAEPNDLTQYWMIAATISIVGIVALPLVYLVGKISSNKYRYWLTNRRIILSSGFIGYTVRSIPLERISDVGLSRTLPEMMAGVSSIVVRDMTGEVMEGKSLVAVDNAPELQRQILNEVQRVNSERVRV